MENSRFALLVTDQKQYTKKELFLFYHFLCKPNSQLYGKMMEIIPVSELTLVVFYVPVSDKMNEKKYHYIKEYIQFLCKHFKISYISYHWTGIHKSMLSQTLSDPLLENNLIQYDWFFYFKRFAKMNRISLDKAKIILICDTPQQVEPILKTICSKVYQIQLFVKKTELFSDLIQYFLKEYGILLKAGDTIDRRCKDQTILMSASTDQEWIQNASLQCELPFLNAAPRKTGLSHCYEDALFSGKEAVNTIAAKWGCFNSKPLLFFILVSHSSVNENNYKKYIKENDIKCVKLIKND